MAADPSFAAQVAATAVGSAGSVALVAVRMYSETGLAVIDQSVVG